MYEAPEERNEAQSASGVGGCGRVVSPSHQFDVFYTKHLTLYNLGHP